MQFCEGQPVQHGDSLRQTFVIRLACARQFGAVDFNVTSAILWVRLGGKVHVRVLAKMLRRVTVRQNLLDEADFPDPTTEGGGDLGIRFRVQYLYGSRPGVRAEAGRKYFSSEQHLLRIGELGELSLLYGVHRSSTAARWPYTKAGAMPANRRSATTLLAVDHNPTPSML